MQQGGQAAGPSYMGWTILQAPGTSGSLLQERAEQQAGETCRDAGLLKGVKFKLVLGLLEIRQSSTHGPL